MSSLAPFSFHRTAPAFPRSYLRSHPCESHPVSFDVPISSGSSRAHANSVNIPISSVRSTPNVPVSGVRTPSASRTSFNVPISGGGSTSTVPISSVRPSSTSSQIPISGGRSDKYRVPRSTSDHSPELKVSPRSIYRSPELREARSTEQPAEARRDAASAGFCLPVSVVHEVCEELLPVLMSFGFLSDESRACCALLEAELPALNLPRTSVLVGETDGLPKADDWLNGEGGSRMFPEWDDPDWPFVCPYPQYTTPNGNCQDGAACLSLFGTEKGAVELRLRKGLRFVANAPSFFEAGPPSHRFLDHRPDLGGSIVDEEVDGVCSAFFSPGEYQGVWGEAASASVLQRPSMLYFPTCPSASRLGAHALWSWRFDPILCPLPVTDVPTVKLWTRADVAHDSYRDDNMEDAVFHANHFCNGILSQPLDYQRLAPLPAFFSSEPRTPFKLSRAPPSSVTAAKQAVGPIIRLLRQVTRTNQRW